MEYSQDTQKPEKLDEFEKYRQAIELFMSRKQTYANQRKPFESVWVDCMKAYTCDRDLKRLYEGRAKINIPIQHWKTEGIHARVQRILFNATPYGRIETKKNQKVEEVVPELWNRYIFEHQLDEIDFKENFKVHDKDRDILGTAVAKIPYEYETKMFSMFDDEEPEEIAIKDNTYFRPILLTEFYTDVNKSNLQESEANIHSTSISFQSLWKNRKRKVTESKEKETTDDQGNTFIITEENTKEVGMYHNLELLQSLGDGVTAEQAEYMSLLGLTGDKGRAFQKSLESIKKTGFVNVDECYGLFDINDDGIEEEVVCLIAEGCICIRLEENPFKHKKYVRPFIAGKYIKLKNCFYGLSKIMITMDLHMELNASRMQASDAKTRAIRPMHYINTDANMIWDGIWRGDGIIRGQGNAQTAMQTIINPGLQGIGYEASAIAQTDMDQAWGLSPVQEGTSDSSKIPSTARATLAVISQNDLPLNNLIEQISEDEVKVFFEMLYERNIQFKTVDDLLVVWSEEELATKGLIEVDESQKQPGQPAKAKLDMNGKVIPKIQMKKLYFDANFKVLGNMELNNEVATQQGWINFIREVKDNPTIVKRLKWKEVMKKYLGAFGIKDDAEGVFIDEAIIREVEQQEAQAQQDQQQQQMAMMEQQKQEQLALAQKDKVDNISIYATQKDIDADTKIKQMRMEAMLEASMPGANVNGQG